MTALKHAADRGFEDIVHAIQSRGSLCLEHGETCAGPEVNSDTGLWHPSPLQVLCEFAIWDKIAVLCNNGTSQ